MSFQIEKKDNCTVIHIESEKLDTNVAPSLKSELVVINSNGEKNIVINIEKTRYCDSSGLSAILVANRLCKNANGTFVLTSVQDSVAKLISISQLDSILNIQPTTEEALQSLSQKA